MPLTLIVLSLKIQNLNSTAMLDVQNKNSHVYTDADDVFICEYQDNVLLDPEDIDIVVVNYDEYAGERDLKVMIVFPKKYSSFLCCSSISLKTWTSCSC